MKRAMLFVALVLVISAGCKRRNRDADPPPANNQGGAGFGAVQDVRGAVNRVVTAAELKDLHIYMTNAKLSMGRVPTAQETWSALNQADGNRQLVQLIKDQVLILVPNPRDEGLWAYSKEAPTTGGWVLTHSEPRRVTPQEFAQLQGN